MQTHNNIYAKMSNPLHMFLFLLLFKSLKSYLWKQTVYPNLFCSNIWLLRQLHDNCNSRIVAVFVIRNYNHFNSHVTHFKHFNWATGLNSSKWYTISFWDSLKIFIKNFLPLLNSLKAKVAITWKPILQSKSIYWFLYDGNFGV